MKHFSLRALSLAPGCFVGLGIAEVALRVFHPQMSGPVEFAHDPQLGAIPVPNQQARRTLPGVYEYTYTNDAHGRRLTPSHMHERKPHQRLLLLGDSQTYGIGVNDNETFASRIAENLAGGDISIEVMNAGNGGKGTDYALKFFRSLGQSFNADTVALCFFPNDFLDNSQGTIPNTRGWQFVRSVAGAKFQCKKRFSQAIKSLQLAVRAFPCC